MTRHARLPFAAFAAAALVALSACGDAGETVAEGGDAGGEVLEGSISDAMLPLDELTSSAPIATPAPTSAATSASPAPAAPDGDEPAVVPEAQAAASAPAEE